MGGEGNDTLHGGTAGGYDTLVGGAGADSLCLATWVSYDNAESAVSVDLITGLGHFGDAEGDHYVSIGNVQGSAFNDTIRGAKAYQYISAGAGNDFIRGMDFNTINGGDGFDTVSYAPYDIPNGGDRYISLRTGSAQGEQYISIEAVIGSQNRDTIEGNSYGNWLDGAVNNDSIEARGGNDTLTGGQGNDYLNGGAGADVFFYDTQSTGTDTIDDFESDHDMIDVSSIGVSLVTAFTGRNQIMVAQSGHQILVNLDTVTATSEIVINFTGVDSITASDLLGLV